MGHEPSIDVWTVCKTTFAHKYHAFKREVSPLQNILFKDRLSARSPRALPYNPKVVDHGQVGMRPLAPCARR